MNQSRSRGVLLTAKAVEILEARLAEWWENAPSHLREHYAHLTLEAMTEPMGCDVKTVRKILRRSGGVYEATLKTTFASLKIPWKPEYITSAKLGYLPNPLTSLLGREQEREEVGGWLQRERLLTLTGAGGVGKTRLALATAQQIAPNYPEGVWFVELAPLADPSQLPLTLLKTLNVREQSDLPPTQTLVQALASRSLLLVLDNCEHLLDACAALAHTLLTTCPHLRLLATSRQPLGLMGERTYRVPSLPLPSLEQAQSEKEVTSLLEYAGIALFVDRGVRVQPSFRLSRENVVAVVGLCQALDGIPLALELAGARLRSLSVEEIASRLDERFSLLRDGDRTALPRHQTLWGMIDWSYQLLNPQERRLLARLAVFAGGWTLEAAERVCAGEGIAAQEVLGLLTSLTDKSLVVATTGQAETRYHFLETVRQYAMERLAERGESAERAEKHLHYFLHRAEEVKRQHNTRPEEVVPLFSQLEPDLDNLRAALRTCQAQRERGAEAGLRLVYALTWFWETFRRMTEGREWTMQALAQPGAEKRTRIRAQVLYTTSLMANLQSDFTTARSLAEESRAIAQEVGDRETLRGAMEMLILSARHQGDFATVLALNAEVETLCSEPGSPMISACILVYRGFYALEQGEWEMARPLLLDGLAALQALEGQTYALGFTLFTQLCLGRLAYAVGDYPTVLSWIAECLPVFLRLRPQADVTAEARLMLGRAQIRMGEGFQARSHFTQALEVSWEVETQYGICEALDCFALLAAWEQDWEGAARLLGGGDRLRERMGCPVRGSLRADHAKVVAEVRQALTPRAFTAAWQAGHSLTIQQMVEYALEGTLPENPFARSRP